MLGSRYPSKDLVIERDKEKLDNKKNEKAL